MSFKQTLSLFCLVFMVGTSLMRAAVDTSLDLMVNNSPPEQALQYALKSFAVDVAGSYGAGQIGAAYGDKALDYFEHKALHAALGAVMGAALNRDDPLNGALAGATGAVVAEIVAEGLIDTHRFFTPQDREFYSTTARLASASAALFTGQNVSTALTTATNAVENNFFRDPFLPRTPKEWDAVRAGAMVEIPGTNITLFDLMLELYTRPLELLSGGAAKIVTQPARTGLKTVVPNALKPALRALPKPTPQLALPAPKSAAIPRARSLKKQHFLPNEGKVGTYGELQNTYSKPGDNLALHHSPNDQYMKSHGIKRNDGISIMVEQPTPGRGGRHREIHKKLQTQDLNLEPRDALAESVQRAREIYRQDGLYDEIRPSLLEIIKQNKEKFPQFFQKKD